ncbi:MAG TPA: hemagglutinin, partial [Hyalangium sp.]|nr:hemagglutinin [Hyalangium sp.]
MRILLSLLGLLAAGVAAAEPDTFGLGTGRDGVLRVDQPNTVINHAGHLTATAAAGTKELMISNAGAFTAGELVLVHQSTGLLPAPASGDQRAINLDASPVGRFEYARVELVGDGSLKLTALLQYSYAASVSQVVNVPEYTDVMVNPGASLTAPPWNGSTGGILALLASSMLINNGTIRADGVGFRGGAFINHPGGEGCTSLDEAAGVGASYKGEGLVAGRFGAASGRGNLATGGGGGNCHSAGGGGGGHIGLGGTGGNTPGQTEQPDKVGGFGGAPVAYLPYQHLL